MTKGELLEILVNLQRSGGDGEQGHIDADYALLDYINDLEIRAAYEAIPDRWYS